MNKYSLLVIFLACSCWMQAQQGARMLLVTQADFSEVDNQFRGIAVKVANDIDCCWDIVDSCKCSDLKDPWGKGEIKLYRQQIDKVISSRAVLQVQKSMAVLEQAVLQGKGKTKIREEDVKKAFDRYPGYQFSAISNRFAIYMQKLKPVR